MLGAFASGVDEAFLAWSVRPSLPRLSMRSSLRSLAIAEQRTQSEVADDALFDSSSPPVRVQAAGSFTQANRRVQQVTTELPESPIAGKWGISDVPQELSTTFHLRGEPRPLLILMSGWVPSRRITPSLVWPLRRLDAAGFDVTVPALPWATQRGNRRLAFPSSDPCRNIVIAAAITDGLRHLVRYARAQGHPKILIGASSLGAHLAALLLTLPEATLVDGVILEKPLGQLSDLIRWHARGDPIWCEHVANRLQRVYRWVCPLDRAPKIATERVTVIGAEFDRVTPLAAAEQVANHFQVPLRPIKASHLIDPGRGTRLLQLFTELRGRSAGCE